MIKRQEVYDQYWKFAYERQEIFFKKLAGENPPYTQDPILANYKFCNVYRICDRVSQYLVKNVIYTQKNYSNEDILFRIFLFRILNKNETWEKLEKLLGDISLKNFNTITYSNALERIKKVGPIYGNAFILCANKAFGFNEKHKNHLALLEKVFVKEKISSRLLTSQTLEELFNNLLSLPLIGNFMAYQLAIDFNYSNVFSFNENDFTIAGPGAIRGIKKCFENIGDKSFSDIIFYMVENQEEEFKRLGLNFKNLYGRGLHAIDCQGLFCEVDKYSRIKFPNLKSNRTRIKTTYYPNVEKITYFFPSKWDLSC